MSNSIVIEATASAELTLSPISPGWILSGTPEARSMMLAITDDRTTWIMVWECTAGRFNWHYNVDETVVIISGEVFVTDEQEKEKRLGPGDMAFFPGGSSAVWRIDDRVKKVAVMRMDLPFPLGIGARAWHKLRRTLGWRAEYSLSPARP